MNNVHAEKRDEKELTGPVKELADWGDEKDIALYEQQQISAEILDGVEQSWYKLDEAQAEEVLTNLKLNGHTFWLNRATGQTDLTDEAEGEDKVDGLVKNEPRNKQLQGMTVYDDEADGMVEVSPDQRSLANTLQRQMDINTLVTAVIMMRMSDDKLYRGVDKGYSSFAEYVEVRCPFGYRQGQKYAKIGRAFAPMLPEGIERGVNPDSPDSDGLNDNIKQLGELGVRKLYELSKIEDVDFSELPSEGTVKLSDGSEMDLEEIKSQSARHFKKKMDEYRAYQQELEQELNTAADARDKAIQAKKQMAKDAETGQKYKDMYGQKSTDFEAYKTRLMTARARAADLNQALSKIKDMPADFESLTEELQDLHGMIDRGLTALREQNLESAAFAVKSQVEG